MARTNRGNFHWKRLSVLLGKRNNFLDLLINRCWLFAKKPPCNELEHGAIELQRGERAKRHNSGNPTDAQLVEIPEYPIKAGKQSRQCLFFKTNCEDQIPLKLLNKSII